MRTGRRTRQGSRGRAGRPNHQFQFLKEQGIGICRCGRWAVAKIPMTALRAQRLAKIYGKDRFGPEAEAILRDGLPFRELTEGQAVQDWNYHIQNLPEKGGRVFGCNHMKKQRQARQQRQLGLVAI